MKFCPLASPLLVILREHQEGYGIVMGHMDRGIGDRYRMSHKTVRLQNDHSKSSVCLATAKSMCYIEPNRNILKSA